MAVIKKDGNFMGLPMNVARGNPIPLDKSEIWYSYDEMETYAKTDPVAYVGQILGLVDEAAGTATAYIILNVAGDLQEIGASVEIPSLMGDNASVIISNDIVALKNWGVQYYRYVAATETEEAHYEIQVVDESHPWISGLEPKVASVDGKMVLGWYEPNPTTIEGVSSQLGSLQTALGDLQKNTYTKEQVDAKIASAGHLKRIIVESVSAINKEAEDADQYIYMVLVSPEDTADKYDEYMVLDFDGMRYVEKVGSWEVDLTNYVTSQTLTTELNKKVDAQEGYSLVSNELISKINNIEANAQKNYISSVDSVYFEVDENGLLSFKGVSTDDVSGLTTLLDGKVDKEEGKGLSSNDFTDAHKTAIAANTQNIQTLDGKVIAIQEILNGVDDVPGLVTIVTDLSGKVQSNSDLLETHSTTLGTIQSTLTTLGTQVETNAQGLITLGNTVEQLGLKLDTIQLDNYVTKAIFETTVGSIADLQAGQKTLHAQVKDIQEAITWGNLDEIIN